MTGESLTDQDSKDASIGGSRSLIGSLFDWFWRGSHLARARHAIPQPSERAVTFAQRARASAELAQNVLTEEGPMEVPTEASACELYRQSVYWGLCTLAERSRAVPSDAYEPAIWDLLVDPLLLVRAVPAERLDALTSTLRTCSFAYFAELPQAEQIASCVELRNLAHGVLAKLDQRAEILDKIYLERTRRLAALVVVLSAAAGGTFEILKVLEARHDLARGSHWVASSHYPIGACTSPAQECTEGEGLFFHTNVEDSPWIEFDLGPNKAVSRVDVSNRVGCCTERASPMTIEVSSDHSKWHSVAKRETEFTSTWSAKFAPVQARWVRLRLLKPNCLHLSRVKIF